MCASAYTPSRVESSHLLEIEFDAIEMLESEDFLVKQPNNEDREVRGDAYELWWEDEHLTDLPR